MRISRKYGLIFLANPKCASTTVEDYIDAFTGGDARQAKRYKRHINGPILDEFMTKRELSYDDFLVFTTIRNPWDRLVSLWSYAQRRPDSIWFEAATGAGSLSEFLHTEIIEVEFVKNFGLYGFTHTPDGRRVVDDVLRVERLDVGLRLMFQRVGIDFVDTGLRTNTSDRNDYRTYYSPADRDMVGRLFEADIEFGQYQF